MEKECFKCKKSNFEYKLYWIKILRGRFFDTYLFRGYLCADCLTKLEKLICGEEYKKVLEVR